MSNREFTATRTMLANGFATAGAELLSYMGVSSALAAIPNTEPPRYVVAGTLTEIVKLLPGAEAIREITTQGVTGTTPAAATVLTDERIKVLVETAGFGEQGFTLRFARAIEREVLAHAGVTAEPAALVQAAETEMAERLRRIVACHGDKAVPVHTNLLTQAAHECDRFYNGMMNWKANAQAKDRTIIELRETSKAAQVPAAEVRAQALEEAANACEAWGNAKVAKWAEIAGDDECGRSMVEDAKARAWDALQCAAAIRSLAQQSTADKASEVRAAEWQPIETAPKDMASRLYLIDRFCVQGFVDATGELMAQSEVSPHWRKMRGKPTHWMPLPAAPSTADSANTGALGEKGAEA